MKTLDQRIREDVTELYRDHIILGAEAINKSNLLEVSAKGLPGYFCGDRDAKTVFVNLNPGIDAAKNDESLEYDERNEKFQFNKQNLESYIACYYEKSRRYGELFRNAGTIIDYFDLKQAAFLLPWENNGIDLPKDFYKGNKDTFFQTQEKSLMQHLQLELLPYASNKFIPKKKHIQILLPYTETLLDEIFRVERKYVIFGSRLFCDLFKLLGDDSNKDFGIEFIRRKAPSEFSIVSKMHFSCELVKIRYKEKTQYAIIANTFPSRALSTALEKMYLYGKECFEFYQSFVNKK